MLKGWILKITDLKTVNNKNAVNVSCLLCLTTCIIEARNILYIHFPLPEQKSTNFTLRTNFSVAI